MQKSLFKNSPHEIASQTMHGFARKLYQQYIIEVDTLISKEKFVKAALMVAHATTLCKINPEFNCDILTFNKTAQTKYGVFDAYLRVAKSAMEMGKLDYAQKYVILAKDFQSQNNGIILSSGPVDSAMKDLAWKYFEQAREFFTIENYEDAYNGFANARELYDMIEVDTYNDLIEKQMRKCIFEN